MEARRTEQSAPPLRPPQPPPFAFSLAAAALDGLFDHPAGCSDAVPDLLECCVAPVPKGFFNNLLVLVNSNCAWEMVRGSLLNRRYFQD